MHVTFWFPVTTRKYCENKAQIGSILSSYKPILSLVKLQASLMSVWTIKLRQFSEKIRILNFSSHTESILILMELLFHWILLKRSKIGFYAKNSELNDKNFWISYEFSNRGWVSTGATGAWHLWNLWTHGNYKWIIMHEKCGRPDSNGFQLKWRFGTHGNWKNQNPGGCFGATS